MRFGRDAGKDSPHEIPDRQSPGSGGEFIGNDMVVRRQLRTGEQLLWTGRPVSGKALARGSWSEFFFGIPFFAFAVFWTVTAASITGGFSRNWAGGFSGSGGLFAIIPIIFPAFGLIFVFVGLKMLTKPFREMMKSGSRIYAVTDQRAIIADIGRSTNMRSFPLGEMTAIERREQDDGSGDVMFAEERRSRAKGGTYTVRHGFLGVGDARGAEDALLQARKSLVADR